MGYARVRCVRIYITLRGACLKKDGVCGSCRNPTYSVIEYSPVYSFRLWLQLFTDDTFARGLAGVVGLMLPLALAAAVRVPYTTSPYSDLGQVVNLSLSVA